MHKRKLHIKSVLNLLLGKVGIVSLLILVQIAVLVVFILRLVEHFTVLYMLFEILSLCLVIFLVSKDENPSYKLAWVVIIMAFPIFGGLFYLPFGNKGLPKSLLLKIQGAEDYARHHLQYDLPSHPQLSAQCPQYSVLSDYITLTTGTPVWEHTQAEYFPLGEAAWERMLEELEKAERYIFMEYFILEEGEMWDPIFAILKKKAAAGLDVRFMFDDIGSIQTLPHNYASRLRAAGIKCVVFNPFQPHLNSMMNYRDHRKITVVDGNVGFCGGINIADEYINRYEKHGHWKDTAVLLRGDGVWNLTALFLSLWNFSKPTDEEFDQFKPTISCESDGFVQPFGDSPLDRLNVSEETYMQIISRATRYVYITTPYLILDNEMTTALSIAARSGVDVRILTPHVPDKWYVHEVTRSFYQPLLDAGVKIYEYTPGFIHAKMYVSDDEVAVVGTANMDYRSFYLHFECGVCFYQSSLIQDVKQDFLQTLTLSQQIPLDYNRSVFFLRRVVRSLLRLFSPMM